MNFKKNILVFLLISLISFFSFAGFSFVSVQSDGGSVYFVNDFVVTTNAPNGSGSLVEAINSANDSPGLDRISFNISEDSKTIDLDGVVLPEITDSIFIDGYTQPGTTQEKPLIKFYNSDFASTGDLRNDPSLTGLVAVVRGIVFYGPKIVMENISTVDIYSSDFFGSSNISLTNTQNTSAIIDNDFYESSSFTASGVKSVSFIANKFFGNGKVTFTQSSKNFKITQNNFYNANTIQVADSSDNFLIVNNNLINDSSIYISNSTNGLINKNTISKARGDYGIKVTNEGLGLNSKNNIIVENTFNDFSSTTLPIAISIDPKDSVFIPVITKTSKIGDKLVISGYAEEKASLEFYEVTLVSEGFNYTLAETKVEGGTDDLSDLLGPLVDGLQTSEFKFEFPISNKSYVVSSSIASEGTSQFSQKVFDAMGNSFTDPITPSVPTDPATPNVFTPFSVNLNSDKFYEGDEINITAFPPKQNGKPLKGSFGFYLGDNLLYQSPFATDPGVFSTSDFLAGSYKIKILYTSEKLDTYEQFVNIKVSESKIIDSDFEQKLPPKGLIIYEVNFPR